MKKFALAVSALAIAAVPFVASAGEEDLTIDGSAAGAGIYYVDADTTSVWEESNDLEGLQTTETVLEDSTVIPADTQVA
jgi:hypothetical protein